MKHMRNAIGMYYAMIVMIIIAVIMTLSLSTGAMTTKSMTDEYVRLQMDLLMDSAIEYALLYISGDASRSITPNDVNISFDSRYHFRIHITPLSGDDGVVESNGTVRLDILGNTTLPLDENYQISKRLLVKP
jgi:hypothetical protein